MDGVTAPLSTADVPPEAPLAQPVQALDRAEYDASAPGIVAAAQIWAWRAAIFLPALGTTAWMTGTFARWRADDGFAWLEWVLVGLVALTFFWICLAVSTATVGLVRLAMQRPAATDAQPDALRVALLVPIYHEDPAEVFGNAAAMMRALAEAGKAHAFELFILSDTQEPRLAGIERAAFAALRATLPNGPPVWYRRRARNTEKKSGNIADWTRRWGGAYDAMVVLDADSLMSAEALTRLADEMAADPSAGLIQSAPALIGSNTLFGRVQQFSSAICGALLAHGLASWTDSEGNYWGHNAILRTRAFAACAGLPAMPSLRGKGGLILSHDFVEAGLLRRAGWAVRFLPEIKGSYEEPPATLIDFALRDRRWCHGNLQHLMLLGTRGFHAVSRFHLLNGAVSYLLSPIWFILLVIWALLGNGDNSVIRYFSDDNPLYPEWPEMSGVSSLLILVFMYGMLLAPKVMGAASLWMTGMTPARLGGWAQFALSFVLEVAASILFAPIMMVQQLVAVLRCLTGVQPSWAPQARKGGSYGLWTVAKFHALETVSGWLLMLGMGLGVVSLWLLPIAISLAFAVPLSLASGIDLTRWRITRRWMATPEILDAPRIIRLARRSRAQFRAMLDQVTPAE
ncbi:glucans biosynthesis glucosyltransferase MdoH [Pseudaestuariivita atlantica]|uniref:Glucans biosynthesis glucosyltransferase H n=1 Tax=Pseudaestuariivita atlantica TaxID=1317121 RepID=A0A0L1JLZ9_9RHOB|nr:glucans biosynthesis glucosyltransferase MdoH [Pseudaestuariivita atlantica]KNG92784.1 glucosyl transferase family 2 [Pseudaestuariivita atlantica]